MARRAAGLTARQVETLRNPGMYADGGGLYLRVADGGSKAWIFRFMLGGRRRDMGLGAADLFPLAQARTRALEARRLAADGISSIAPAAPPEAPAEPVTPGGINHLVINVRDIEESHKFWTEMLGFKQVGYSKRRQGKMRFYSGDHNGRMNHHDIALCENPNLPKPPAEWAMFDMPVAINHIAITLPNREAWLKQLAYLRAKGVKFQNRINHGMTHSLYIVDPNGYGVEVLYELPREVWGDNIQGAIDYAERLPTEGDEAFVDDTDYPHFGAAKA